MCVYIIIYEHASLRHYYGKKAFNFWHMASTKKKFYFELCVANMRECAIIFVVVCLYVLRYRSSELQLSRLESTRVILVSLLHHIQTALLVLDKCIYTPGATHVACARASARASAHSTSPVELCSSALFFDVIVFILNNTNSHLHQ